MTVKLIGADDAAFVGGWAGDYFHLCKFTAIATGSCSEIRIKAATNGYVKVAIYSDSAGEPNARLAKQDTSTAVSAGWNTIALEASCSLVNGTSYWLAVNNSASNLTGYGTANTTPLRYKAATYSTFTFPDPVGTSFTSTTAYWGLMAGWGTVAAVGRSFGFIIG